jgi:hypothetical protein
MPDEPLSLENICNGGVPEIFERELTEVLKNIADVNTESEAQRKITFEFVFEPYADRSGAMVRFRCKSKLSPVEEVSGQMFVQRSGTHLTAIAHNPNQARLFNPPASSGDEKGKPS